MDGGMIFQDGQRIAFNDDAQDYLVNTNDTYIFEASTGGGLLCLGNSNDCITTFRDGGSEVLEQWITRTFHPDEWMKVEECPPFEEPIEVFGKVIHSPQTFAGGALIGAGLVFVVGLLIFALFLWRKTEW